MEKFDKRISEIEIYVPSEVKQIIVEAGSNEVITEGLQVEDLALKVTDGKVNVSNVAFQNMTFQCVNGPCEIRDIKVSNQCEIQTLNGKASLFNSLTRACGYDIRCENGVVEFLCEQAKSPLYREGIPFF